MDRNNGDAILIHMTETRHVTLTPMEYQVFVQMAHLHQEKKELRVMPMRGLRRLTRYVGSKL